LHKIEWKEEDQKEEEKMKLKEIGKRCSLKVKINQEGKETNMGISGIFVYH
jgi:hypothetical protein